MKIFKVWVDEWDYDEFDAAIVVAESEEEIRKKFITTGPGQFFITSDNTRWYGESPREAEFWFTEPQGEIHIEEVDTTKPGVVLTSFHAE